MAVLTAALLPAWVATLYGKNKPNGVVEALPTERQAAELVEQSPNDANCKISIRNYEFQTCISPPRPTCVNKCAYTASAFRAISGMS